jgi:choline dehydrogenase
MAPTNLAPTSLDADVVVVGGGSAGCAAVHRLALGGLRVLLVEAGPDYGPAGSGRWPAELLDPRRLATTHDWGFGEQRPDGRVVATPRARVIGGCSAHNQCGAWWGLPADYDRWARLTGDRRWSWRALRPYVDRVEGARVSGGGGGGVATPMAIPRGRGLGGLLATCAGDEADLAVWQRAFMDAALAAGYPRVADLSGAALPDGVAPFWVNIAEGCRVNSAFAFLDPLRGRSDVDLRVVDGVLADRLVVDHGRAVALLCRRDRDRDGPALEVTARSFVLAAGTYGSPAILLRSGIGPAARLAALGISVAIDLAPVGANLHDHPGAALRFAPSVRARGLLDAELAAGRFWQTQVGLRAKAGRLHLFPYQDQSQRHERHGGGWALELYAFVLAPRSRGRLWLRSPDPTVPPGIDVGFLSDGGGRDLAALRRGVALAGTLAQTPPLAQLCDDQADDAASLTRQQRPRPGALAPGSAGWLRERVGGYGHPVGTCRMGHHGDPTAVVDADGLVTGTTNLMVADASVIPAIPHAGTNLTASLLGWCVAERLSRRLASKAHR